MDHAATGGSPASQTVRQTRAAFTAADNTGNIHLRTGLGKRKEGWAAGDALSLDRNIVPGKEQKPSPLDRQGDPRDRRPGLQPGETSASGVASSSRRYTLPRPRCIRTGRGAVPAAPWSGSVPRRGVCPSARSLVKIKESCISAAG